MLNLYMLFIIILYMTILGKAEPEMAKRETKERQTLPKAQDVSTFSCR